MHTLDAQYLALSHIRGMNVTLAAELLSRLPGGIEGFFTMSAASLHGLTGASSHISSSDDRLKALEEARAELEFARSHGIDVMRFDSPESGYPPLLSEAEDAPAALFSLGPARLAGKPVIAIVGTRHATAHGAAFTAELIETFALTMVDKPVIVSGLAYGIDIAAHRAALKNGLPTVAVLAHGLNTIYPAAHRNAAAEIIEAGGALLTEYYSSDTIHRGNFLARNRIVAGVADCTIVVESDSRGGAMSTARVARAYDREVFAVPGRPCDKYSRGCNDLIAASQAELLTDPVKLIKQMGWPSKDASALQQELFHELSDEERTIADMLRVNDEMAISDIRARTGMPIGRLMALLVEMEYNSLIESLPGSRYRLTMNA